VTAEATRRNAWIAASAAIIAALLALAGVLYQGKKENSVAPSTLVQPHPDVRSASAQQPNGVPGPPVAVPNPAPKAAARATPRTELTGKTRRECLENERCEGARVLACFPRPINRDEIEGDLDWYLAPAHPDYTLPRARQGNIKFGEWVNTGCNASGSGWHLHIGTCKKGGNSAGWQPCAKVLVEFDNPPAGTKVR
jgi:hypothetical protein